MKIKLYETNGYGAHISKFAQTEMSYKNIDIVEEQGHPGDVEAFLINIHDDIEFQEFGGIGGAFSDSSASLYAQMPEDKKEEVIRAYFDREKGIGYTFGRLTIGSCDFSKDYYTYIDEGDMALDTFSLEHDEKEIFPMVKDAQKYADLTLFASPWSPPSYMKTNGSRIGGHLKKDCYALWAKHFKKYIDGCKQNGIDIWGVTMQNEPRHHQTWESCLYTPEEEAEFLGYLGRELEGSGVKILCYDHCRERVYEWAKYVYESENGKYCDGIANHWYSGDHFGELRAHAKKYPDKISVASESCNAVAKKGIYKDVDLGFAEAYAHDIMGCFNNGLHYYCDWNLILDENNGPHHNRVDREFSVDPLVYYHTKKNELIYRLTYYYVGQISKFAKPGAKVISSSSYSYDLETLALKNPDGEIVCIVLNRTDKEMPAIIRLNGHIYKFTSHPHSIVTAVIEK